MSDIRAALARPEDEGFVRPLDPAEVDDLDPFALIVPLPCTAEERAKWRVYVAVWEEDGERHVLRGFSWLGARIGALIDSAPVRP